MFDKIWKEQIVKPSSNVSIFKPKQGFDLEEEEDDDKCCEDAKNRWKYYWMSNEYNFDELIMDGEAKEIINAYDNRLEARTDEPLRGVNGFTCEKFKGFLERQRGALNISSPISFILKKWEDCENV